jgi:hypothetical protein
LEDFTISFGKHLDGGRAQNVKYREKKQASRNAKKKSFEVMVSERPEIKPAEKITEIGADATGDQSRKAQVTRTKAFEWNYCGGVS